MNKEEYIKLLESMNTVDPIEWNKDNKDFEWGPFKIQDNNTGKEMWFVAQIIYRTRIPDHNISELKGARIGEVSFMDYDNEKRYDTTGNVGFDSIKVYSILGHAMSEKLKTEYDVLYFDINETHSNSKNQYTRKLNIAERVVKKLMLDRSSYFYAPSNKNKYTPNSNTYLISKIKLSDRTERECRIYSSIKRIYANGWFRCRAFWSMNLSEFNSKRVIHTDYFVWMDDTLATCFYDQAHVVINMGGRETIDDRVKNVDFYVVYNKKFTKRDLQWKILYGIKKEISEKLWEYDGLMFKNEWNDQDQSLLINDFLYSSFKSDDKVVIFDIEGGFIITRKPDILEEILNGNKS